MFPFLSDGFLRLVLYVGTLAAFLVFLGGVAAVVLTLRSDKALQDVNQELLDTRRALSGRTISPTQMEQLKASVDECWKGINIQVANRFDMESSSFAESLEFAFRDAGFTTFPYELPTLEVGTGSDVAVYMPGARGEQGLAKLLETKLYKTLTGFGLSVGGTNAATTLTPSQIRTQENEISSRVEPDYCILIVQQRPPARLSGMPYFVEKARQPMKAPQPTEAH